MTEKSKFGLAAGLMGAFVYFVGGFSLTGLVLLLIAVTVWEDNEFVKICMGRVTFIYLVYNICEEVFSVLHNLIMKVGFIAGSGVGTFLNNMHSSVWSWLWILYRILILVLAILAIVKPEANVTFIDKFADKLTKAVKVKAAGKTCPDCGKAVAEDAAFCTGCGHKFEA